MDIEKVLSYHRERLAGWQNHLKRFDALIHCHRHIEKHRAKIFEALKIKYGNQ